MKEFHLYDDDRPYEVINRISRLLESMGYKIIVDDVKDDEGRYPCSLIKLNEEDNGSEV